MRIFSWFTRNWADTDEGFHPDLAPLELRTTPAETLVHLKAIISRLPRWKVESADLATALLEATRRTSLFRFVDDITLRLETLPFGTRLHARSQSRLGRGDFGQNRRNVLELFRELQSR